MNFTRRMQIQLGEYEGDTGFRIEDKGNQDLHGDSMCVALELWMPW